MRRDRRDPARTPSRRSPPLPKGTRAAPAQDTLSPHRLVHRPTILVFPRNAPSPLYVEQASSHARDVTRPRQSDRSLASLGRAARYQAPGVYAAPADDGLEDDAELFTTA